MPANTGVEFLAGLPVPSSSLSISLFLFRILPSQCSDCRSSRLIRFFLPRQRPVALVVSINAVSGSWTGNLRARASWLATPNLRAKLKAETNGQRSVSSGAVVRQTLHSILHRGSSHLVSTRLFSSSLISSGLVSSNPISFHSILVHLNAAFKLESLFMARSSSRTPRKRGLELPQMLGQPEIIPTPIVSGCWTASSSALKDIQQDG